MERHQPASQLNPLGTALARWHTTGYRSAQGYHSTGTNTPAFRVHHIRAFSTVSTEVACGNCRLCSGASLPVSAVGSRTEHGSNLTYCSRIQAAVCSLVHSFPHERLCQRGCLNQDINLPSCGVRLEFEASLPVSERYIWVSLKIDPYAVLLSGNDTTCTGKSKL